MKLILILFISCFNLYSLETDDIDQEYALITDEGQETKSIQIQYYPASCAINCCFMFKCKKGPLIYTLMLPEKISGPNLMHNIKELLTNNKVFYPIDGHLKLEADNEIELEPNALKATINLKNVNIITVQQIPIID